MFVLSLVFVLSVSIVTFLGFVTWAKEEIEKYADVFRLQVFSSDVEQEAVEECIQITHNQSKKVSCISNNIHDTLDLIYSIALARIRIGLPIPL